MRFKLPAIPALALLATLLGCGPPYSVRIVDPSGKELPTTTRHGVTVVTGKVGQSYELEITNRTSERIAVVVSVDGLDSRRAGPADVTTEGLKQRAAYIIEDYARSTIRGFEIGPTLVSTFRFADPPSALASQLQGGAAVLGRIDVALLAVKPVALPAAAAERPVDDADYVKAPAVPAPARSAPPVGQVFGEAVADAVGTAVAYQIDEQAPLLRRVTISYEDPHGQKLGTAGPPPPAAPASTGIAREPPSEEGALLVEPNGPTKGGKPSKPIRAGKPTKEGSKPHKRAN